MESRLKKSNIGGCASLAKAANRKFALIGIKAPCVLFSFGGSNPSPPTISRCDPHRHARDSGGAGEQRRSAGGNTKRQRGLIIIKQGKRPTAEQKKYLSGTLKLNPKDYMVISWEKTGAKIQRKSDGTIKNITFS